jgi:hypothetical protein
VPVVKKRAAPTERRQNVPTGHVGSTSPDRTRVAVSLAEVRRAPLSDSRTQNVRCRMPVSQLTGTSGTASQYRRRQASIWEDDGTRSSTSRARRSLELSNCCLEESCLRNPQRREPVMSHFSVTEASNTPAPPRADRALAWFLLPQPASTKTAPTTRHEGAPATNDQRDVVILDPRGERKDMIIDPNKVKTRPEEDQREIRSITLTSTAL